MSLLSCWSGNAFTTGDEMVAGVSGFTFNNNQNTFFNTNTFVGRPYVNFAAGGFQRKVAMDPTKVLEMQINLVCTTTSSRVAVELFSATSQPIMQIRTNGPNWQLYNPQAGNFETITEFLVNVPQRITFRAFYDGTEAFARAYVAGKQVAEIALTERPGLDGTAADIIVDLDTNGTVWWNDVLVYDEPSTGDLEVAPKVYEIVDYTLDPASVSIVSGTGSPLDIVDNDLSTSSSTVGTASVTATLEGMPNVLADKVVFSGAHGTASSGQSQTVLKVTDPSELTIYGQATVDAPEVIPRVGVLGVVDFASTTTIPGDARYKFETP